MILTVHWVALSVLSESVLCVRYRVVYHVQTLRKEKVHLYAYRTTSTINTVTTSSIDTVSSTVSSMHQF